MIIVPQCQASANSLLALANTQLAYNLARYCMLSHAGAAPLPITITTDTLDGEPQRGQPATIVCRVQHAPLGTSIFWLKAASLPTSLHRHPGDDVTDMELIATNTTTTPLYRRIGRYTAQSHLLGDVAIFTLHISSN